MDRGSYRELRPAASSPEDGRQYPTPPDKLKPIKKRAHITKVACNACREKKSACDGRRPSCQMCVNRGSECVYTSKDESETPTMALKRVNESLKQTTDALEELVNCLKFMPEETAQFILRKLRTASELDPAAILQSIKNDMELPTSYFSEQTTARATLPPIQSEREFELMASHSNAYPTLDPSEDAQLASSPALRPPTPTNPKRRSKSRGVDTGGDLYLASLTPPDTTASSSSSGHNLKAQVPERDPDPMNDDTDMAAEQVDSPFEKLNIGFWTTVSISNTQAAEIITMYLSTDHPVLGLFDFDLFVNDLVNCQFQHCSSFLLTSLLAFASQSYASKEPSSFAKSYEFENEAEKLWQIEGRNDSLTSIAGLSLLSQSVGCHGQVKSTAKYLKALTAMAARMRLFGIEERLQVKDIVKLSRGEQSSASFAAWGAFNVITRMSAYFNLLPATPYYPEIPIPGTVVISQEPNSEGKVHVLLHPSMGETFTYTCSLWTIVSESMYLLRTEARSDRVPIAVPLSRYYQLLELADNLPKSMIRQEHNAPHVLVFHIWFHAAALEFFRPYIVNEKKHDFRDWHPAAPTPHSLFAASIRQLKRLMLVYFATHKPPHTIFWHTALLQVANAVLNDLGNVDSRFYFITCIRGYAHLFTGFLVSKGIAQSLLAMALSKKAIAQQDAVHLIEELQNNDGSRRKLTDKSAGFVVDLNRAVNDPDGALVERLSDQFEQITIFEAYTTGMME